MKENEIILFHENAGYTTEMAAKILHRNPQTVRKLCKNGVIPARLDRGGYIISGWALRAYMENRSIVNVK